MGKIAMMAILVGTTMVILMEAMMDDDENPRSHILGRVRRVGVFEFGTGRVGYLQKSSGTGTGRDG